MRQRNGSRASRPGGARRGGRAAALGGALAVALAALGGCSEGAPPVPPARIPEPYHLNRYEQSFGYSQAVKIGRTVYISATVAVDADGQLVGPGDMAAQLDAVYANLGATLKAEGGGFAQVVMERIYTTDMEALLKVADRRLKSYPEGQRPATTWVEVRRLVDPGFLVAVEAVAELP
ncbi:MAG TPA: RidA family protein [Steroidobacteraceae bacterium]|nr:RidA family protein [Steroidobacteraceae bacterium]